MSNAFVQALLMDDPDSGTVPPVVIGGPGVAPTPAPDGSGGTCLTDPYYNVIGGAAYEQTVLLLHFDEANGATTVADSSYRGRSTTGTGNAAVTTADKKFGTGSAYFDGVGDFFVFNANNTDWNFGTGDFTVECWMKSTQTGTRHLVGNWVSNFVGTWALRMASGKLVWHRRGNDISPDYEPAQWAVVTGTITINDGQWHHVAATRTSGLVKLFVDGVADGSATQTTAFSTSASISVGADAFTRDTSLDYQGYIDEVRVLLGVSAYTATFTPRTTAFDSFGTIGTVLLMHMENGLTDSSSANRTATVIGTAAVSSAKSKFGAQSLLLNATSGVSFPDSNDFYWAAGDFTIEFWVYHNTTGSVSQTYIWHAVNGSSTGTDTNIGIDMPGGAGAGGNFRLLVYSGLTGYGVVTGVSTMQVGVWQHVAVCRAKATLMAFVDGVLLGYSAIGTAVINNPVGPMRIGIDNTNAHGLDGYIDELRMIKGACKYGTFAIPTAEYPNDISDPYWSSVIGLFHMNGTNGATTITDSSSYNRTTYAGVSGAQLSTTDKKFGTASLNGVNSSQITFDRSGTEFNATSWTIEFWYKRTGSSNYQGFYFTTPLWIILRAPNNSGTYQVYVGSNAYGYVTGNTSIPLNSWCHIAVTVERVGSNNTIRIFYNGALDAEVVFSTVSYNFALTSGATPASIGRTDLAGFAGIIGYIDDYRITAACRYTSAFTPPAYQSCDFSSVTIGASGPGTEMLTGQSMTASTGYINSPAGFARLTGQALTVSPGSATVFSAARSVALTGQALTVSRGTLATAKYPNLISADVTVPLASYGAPTTILVNFNSDGSVTQQINGGAVTAFAAPYWAYPADGLPNATTHMVPVTAVPGAFRQAQFFTGGTVWSYMSYAANTTMAAGCTVTFTILRSWSGLSHPLTIIIVPTASNPRLPEYSTVGYSAAFRITFTE